MKYSRFYFWILAASLFLFMIPRGVWAETYGLKNIPFEVARNENPASKATKVDQNTWAIPILTDKICLTPEAALIAFQGHLRQYLKKTFQTQIHTTKPVFYLPNEPLAFAAFKNGKKLRYGFGWQAGDTLYFNLLPQNRAFAGLHDLKNAGGEVITTLEPRRLVKGHLPFVGVYRHDFWQAEYLLFGRKGYGFVPVWQVSPITSVKGAYTEERAFGFSDYDGDGRQEILVKITRCENCWADKPVVEKSRQWYGWDETAFQYKKLYFYKEKKPADPI